MTTAVWIDDSAAKLGRMGPPPDRPISDPLLRPDSGPRDFTGAPVRAPLGNSIRTLLVLSLLVAIGVGVWWIRRPADVTTSLGAREWTIVSVDGEPATNRSGTASTFVLDGSGEIRAAVGCNVASGTWAFDPNTSRLDIAWSTQTELSCAEDWPVTFRPHSGSMGIDDATMTVESDMGTFEAISLVDRTPADAEGVTGTWVSGEYSVEIGRRGRFEIDECHGSWSPTEDDVAMLVSFDEVQRDACRLAPMWRDETPVVPVLHDGALYLRRDRAMFPLDREIVRLDLGG